ncbi:MAG TPA: rhomboid family intramembrane serine protease [Gemmatimonadales bacterium]|nr:rhomboid family intramembrane serine protease [Gemmatimonadales bacterium]
MSVVFPRMTRWVGRLMAANVIIALLLATVLTSAKVTGALRFTPLPDAVVSRPWTLLTYMFVHGGMIHLAVNMLVLYFFGGAVEQRMGSKAFLFYYLYCGLGAAVFSLGLSALLPGTVPPFLGASGAVLGVALAFAMYWPDAEVMIFPVPIRARTVVIIMAGVAAFASLVLWNSRWGQVAHLAHLGGMLSGYLFFRIQALSQRAPIQPQREAERVVMVQSSTGEAEHQLPHARPPVRPPENPLAVELDRVLDKINAKGLTSLTPEERRFLDDFARNRQKNSDF